MTDEHKLDLFWHALNYRSAGTMEATVCWLKMVACVNRLIAQGKPLNAEGLP